MDDFYTNEDYAFTANESDPIYMDQYDSGQDPSAGGDDPSFGGGSNVVDTGGIVDNPTDTTSDLGFTTPIQVLNEAKKGEPGYGWKYYTDGTAISPDGKYYLNNQLVYDTKALDSGILGVVKKMFGENTASKLKKLFVNDKGDVNLGALAGIAGGIYSLAGGNTPKTGGYKGTVPKYEAVRRSITQPEYKPYSGEPAMGRRYFSDVAYVPKTDTAGIAAAEENAAKQIAELEKYVPRIAQPEKKKDKTESKGITSILTPEQLIAKERGIVADKNVPAGDVMSEVKRLNPQLDWSKYDPNKMTMDVDDYTRAINNYYTSKGFTLPSRNQKSKDLEKIAGNSGMPPPPGGGKIVPAESEYGYPKSEDSKWYFADGKWLPNEEIHLDPAEWMGSFGNTPEDFGYKEIPKSSSGINNPDLLKPQEINQPAPQLSDAINLLKSGGSKDDAVKIMRQIVGLDGPATTAPPVSTNVAPGTYLSTGTGKITTVPSTSAPATTTMTDVTNISNQGNAASNRDRPSGFAGRLFDRRNSSNNSVQQETTELASGGIAMLAKGRYLRGSTDGMADKIPSSIDNKQPAKLSHGEFVIPADVVSHLGNGNSDAGADVLYKMMDRVRKARTGTKRQGRQINPKKFMPGGIAGYAGGGAVAFQGGGAASTGITTSGNATTETSLAPWAGDAVTDYIGRGTALAKESYIPYQGALTAGVSPLQQQGFDKAAGLGGTFDSAAASQYMNPYIQNALQPQLNELRRQADISQQALSGKFAGAGALGGARDAIARSEGIRNLLSQQSGVIGGAYKDAYDKAMQQYNTSRTQDINDLNAIMSAGQTQRGIEEDKIKADRAAFEEERLDPYQKIKFEQSLFTGLPLSSTTTTPNLSPIQQIGQSGKDITQLYDMINKWLGTTG